MREWFSEMEPQSFSFIVFRVTLVRNLDLGASKTPYISFISSLRLKLQILIIVKLNSLYLSSK